MRFRYQAADGSGRHVSGHLEATGPQDARAALRARGLTPFALTRAWTLGAVRSAQGPGRLRLSEQAVFTRQMATLLSGGVQVDAALSTLVRQSSTRLSAVSRQLHQSVVEGRSLSTALRDAQCGMDRFYLMSVQAGESAGRLAPVLDHLANHAEDRLLNRQTVALALIYPVILALASLAVVIGLLAFLLPDIVRVFAARGADLPWLTRVMISASDGLTGNWAEILATLVGLCVGSLALMRRPDVRRARDRVLWRSGLARRISVVRFTGTLATLTQSGVRLTDALGSAVATVGNLEARQTLSAVARQVRDGQSLSRALSEADGFPPMMITMIASGEASGRLPQMLGRYAADQSQALQARVKALVGLVEPLVLLVMGGIVMLIVLAILSPIVGLNALVG